MTKLTVDTRPARAEVRAAVSDHALCSTIVTVTPKPDSERALQAWFVQHIRAGRLAELIDGIEELRGTAAALNDDRILPSLPIDYLLRRKAIEAALAVVNQLPGAELVSDDRNVSADPGDRMRPDILLWGTETGALIPVELKVSEKAEREAIGEILSYDFEIANHLPFGAHGDRPIIVVARDYSTLLEHAIGSLLVWHGRRVLCLRVVGSGETQRLAIHLPNPWTRIGQVGIPSDAIATITLSAMPRQPEAASPEAMEAAIATAFGIIVREGDRLGSHGFATLWRAGSDSGAPWLITIGVVDPRAMLDLARRKGFLSRDSDALTRWFADNEDWATTDPASLVELTDRAEKFLERYCLPELELVASFDEAWPALRNTGMPAAMDFWGVLGDYAREVALHPITQEELAGEDFHGDWRDPSFALPLALEIMGEVPFALGRFLPSELRRFGVLFGSLCAWIENTGGDGERGGAVVARAHLAWLEFVSPFRAIVRRYRATPDVGPSPDVAFGLGEHAEKSLAVLDAWAQWLVGDFIGKNEAHAFGFAVGLELYAVFDSSWASVRESPEIEAQLLDGARSRATELLNALHRATDDWQPAETESAEYDEKLAVALGGVVGEPAQRAALGQLGIEELVHFLDVGVELLDRFAGDLPHRLAPVEPTRIDWAWLISQFREAEGRGMHIAIVLAASGELGIHSIPAEHAALIRGASSDDVLIGSAGTMLTLRRVSVEELVRDGMKLFSAGTH